MDDRFEAVQENLAKSVIRPLPMSYRMPCVHICVVILAASRQLSRLAATRPTFW